WGEELKGPEGAVMLGPRDVRLDLSPTWGPRPAARSSVRHVSGGSRTGFRQRYPLPGCSGPRRTRGFFVARDGDRRIGKLHHAVVDLPALQHHEIERVVLVELPRRLRALLREHVDRPLNVAGREVEEGRRLEIGLA